MSQEDQIFHVSDPAYVSAADQTLAEATEMLKKHDRFVLITLITDGDQPQSPR